MKRHPRVLLGWLLMLGSCLLIAARFHLKSMGRSHDADLCTIAAFILMVLSGCLRHQKSRPPPDPISKPSPATKDQPGGRVYYSADQGTPQS